MTFTTRLTNVRYRREHVDERTEMCYHQTPPSERVVVHVRDAGQAKPRLEHHPLSLLGACYATPRRKLNDPGAASGPLKPCNGSYCVRARCNLCCSSVRICIGSTQKHRPCWTVWSSGCRRPTSCSSL